MARPRPRILVAAALVVAASLASACAAARPDATYLAEPPDFGQLELRAQPDVPPDALRALSDARVLAGLGRAGDAFARIEPVLGAHPRFLEGERFLQDLLAGTRSDVWLLRRTEARRAAAPDDADAVYLSARTQPSRSRQAELFAGALRLDPGHPYARIGRALALERSGDARGAAREAWRVAAEAPWLSLPWTYLGAAAYSRGASDAAVRFLREASVRSPDEARLWSGIAAAYDDLDRGEEAARAAVEAVRRAPGDPATLNSLSRLLERRGGPREIRDALEAVEHARTRSGAPGVVEAFRARLLTALGRCDESETALVAALAAGVAPGEVAVTRRVARFGAGRPREAVDGWLADLPGDPTGPADERAPAWRELVEAARAGEPDDAAAAVRLSAALDAVGWTKEAVLVLARAEARWPDDDDLRSHADAARRFASFLDDLAASVREFGRRQRRGEQVTVGEILDALGRASLARLGVDASQGVRRVRYALLGEFASSAGSEGAFRDVFTSHGLHVLVGARTGRSAELMVGRLVSRRPGVRALALGHEVEYDEHWVETDGLPDGLDGRRGGLAGITLGRFVMIQLDVVRRESTPEDAGLPYLPRPATDDASLRALDTPSDVARRIERSLAVRGTLDRDELDAVVRHERLHVHDASRLLPPWSHPFAAFAFALGNGFSASAMERELESRAGVAALVDADEPRAALAALLGFLPAEDGETPHVAGYRGLVGAAVDEIVRDPAAFPEIDLRWNVVQQMDRISSDHARELGRRLARRMGE